MAVIGFDLGRRHVGEGSPCLIVAEVAQAHDGSLGMAHAYVDAVAEAGADAVKFQCHIAAAESDPGEPWRVRPTWPQDQTRYAYWKRMEFQYPEWADLAAHAAARELIFLCSPFSIEAVRLLEGLVPAWKIASGEVGNKPMLEAIEASKKPVILSTGMSTVEEIVAAHLRMHVPVALLQCTSAYPPRADQIGLSVMTWMQTRFNCPVGLSDHSGSIYPSLGAVALGASIVEVHICFEGAYSMDAAVSITPKQLKRLANGVWWIEQALKPVDKNKEAKELGPMRELFGQKWKRKAAGA